MILCVDPSIQRHAYSFDLIRNHLLEGATDIIPEHFTLTYSLDNDRPSVASVGRSPLLERLGLRGQGAGEVTFQGKQKATG